MDDPSGLKIDVAKTKDIKDIINLLYITEPEPEEEWGIGSEREMKSRLRKLLKIRDNRFSLENIIVLRKNEDVAGIVLYLEGEEINELTSNSEKKVFSMQTGFKNKLDFFIKALQGKFYKECMEDEFYISNIAIKEKYRGCGYSQILFNKVYETAKQKGYDKVSLLANNEHLVRFYSKEGFKLRDSKIRSMVKAI